LDFIFYVNGKYEQIYAFEPDVVNHSVIRRNFADVQNIQLCNNAVSNTNGKVGFDNRGTQSSHIINDDQSFVGEKIQAVRLDDACASTPTLIKMDIEGGEYNALLGARNIIEQSKPKLAISIYHCEDDLCRLPLLIQSMRTDYKFYILHHSPSYTDTVLYAL
jgi:FkbM family methyltransferase